MLKARQNRGGEKINDLIPTFTDKTIFFKCPSVYNYIKAGIWMNVCIAILYLTITGKVSLGYIISSALDSVRCSRDVFDNYRFVSAFN